MAAELCKHCKISPTTPSTIYCNFCLSELNSNGHLPVLCTRQLDCECEQCLEDAEDDLEAGRYDLDESMDGDFDSGMASAGFGTDEDYNHWEGGFDHDPVCDW